MSCVNITQASLLWASGGRDQMRHVSGKRQTAKAPHFQTALARLTPLGVSLLVGLMWHLCFVTRPKIDTRSTHAYYEVQEYCIYRSEREKEREGVCWSWWGCCFLYVGRLKLWFPLSLLVCGGFVISACREKLSRFSSVWPDTTQSHMKLSFKQF